jgi:hypothetical protein
VMRAVGPILLSVYFCISSQMHYAFRPWSWIPCQRLNWPMGVIMICLCRRSEVGVALKGKGSTGGMTGSTGEGNLHC